MSEHDAVVPIAIACTACVALVARWNNMVVSSTNVLMGGVAALCLTMAVYCTWMAIRDQNNQNTVRRSATAWRRTR